MVAIAQLLLPLINPPLLLPAPKKVERKPLLNTEEIKKLEDEANKLLEKYGAINVKAEFKDRFGTPFMIFSGTTHKTCQACQASVEFSKNHSKIKISLRVQRIEPIDIVLQELEKNLEGLELSSSARRMIISKRLRELNQ